MTRMNGGQIIVDYLIQERVPYLFGLCGHALAAGKPYLVNANIAADLNPGGAGVWELPGLGHRPPAFGGRHAAE